MTWQAMTKALASPDGAVRAVLTLVAGTGIRRTELARMRQVDLDVPGRRIVVPVGKKRPRELPMHEAAVATAEAVLALGTEPALLPGRQESNRVEWLTRLVRGARAASGEKKLALHELRRVFASRLAETEPMVTVAALLGHALPGVTGLYVRANLLALKQAMERVWGALR